MSEPTVKACDTVCQEKRKLSTKMRLHIAGVIMSGLVTLFVVKLHLDQTNTIAFAFGPVGPSIVTEVIDFIKGL